MFLRLLTQPFEVMSARFREHRVPDLVHRVPRRDEGTVCLVPLQDLEDAPFMIPISSSGEGDTKDRQKDYPLARTGSGRRTQETNVA